MGGIDKRKQSLYFAEAMLKEISDEATRQDRSLSWIVQQAWKAARKEIMSARSVNDVQSARDKGDALPDRRIGPSSLEVTPNMMSDMSYSSAASIVISAPRQNVWDALTKPEIAKEYFFGTDLVTDWKIGSPLFFRGQWDGKAYEDKGTVLSFDPTKSLSFNYWSTFSGLEDRPDLRQIIRYGLEETDQGVRVTIDQSNVDSRARADHSAKNWLAVLEGLKRVLETATPQT